MNNLPEPLSELQAPETQGERAAWMAGIGGFVINQAVRDHFDNLQEVPESRIIDGLEFYHRVFDAYGQSLMNPEKRVMHEISVLLKKTAMYTSNIEPGEIEQQDTFQSNLKRFTFKKTLPGVLDEAVTSVIIIPLNLLLAAEKQRPIAAAPLFTAIGDLPEILRASWFKITCTNAAMTASAIWDEFSLMHQEFPNINDRLSSIAVLDFEYYDDTHGASAFRFSKDAKARLLQYKNNRNSSAPRALSESWDKGSTIGCPAARRRQTFNSPEEVELLSKAYGVSPEVVMASAPETTIAYCLDKIADYLARVVALRPAVLASEQY